MKHTTGTITDGGEGSPVRVHISTTQEEHRLWT
jgi:hypothetical protein